MNNWIKLKAVRAISLFAAATFTLLLLVPITAEAGNLTARSLTLTSSQANTPTTWTFGLTPSASQTLKSIRFQVCTTPSSSFSSCSAPGSWSNSGATLGSVSTGSGWTIDLSTNSDSLGVTSTTNSTANSSAFTVAFNNVTNPNFTGTFYVRIATYTASNYTSQADGINSVAAATATQITVSSSVLESLVFCSGVTVSSNCSSTSGSSVNLGTMNTSAAVSGTSQLGASTNAGTGYVITYTAPTGLFNGSHTITAGSNSTSSPGTEMFGLNLKANTTPSVGSNVSHLTGSSVGSASGNYNNADHFTFNSGDQVASSGAAPSDFDTYTVSYVGDMAGNTAQGNYTVTFTYICTPTF